MAEIDPKRAQLLGNLIREAREHNGRTPADCAAVLDMSVEEFTAVENGEHPVSLPELEALAIYLQLPMDYFWGKYRLEDVPQTDFQKMIALRQRVIGVLLSQSRLQAGLSHAQIADATGIDQETLQAFEMGAEPIPYIHLEQIAKTLEVSIDAFLDDGRGPLGRHEAQKQLQAQFTRMSPEMQSFLTNPVNAIYMETAKKLSEMDVRRLRQVAESILEITL
jgi:transcriptional regulator with XRE-family HTH domain